MCFDCVFHHGESYAISALVVCGWYAIELFEYLLFNDFAKTYRNKNLVETNGVSYYENRNGASHLMRLSVTYAFNGKKSYKGKKSVPDEINRLR